MEEEEEGGRREEDRSPRGGGGPERGRAPRGPGDRALPRGRDAGVWGIWGDRWRKRLSPSLLYSEAFFFFLVFSFIRCLACKICESVCRLI